ncbi:MAG: hypothetical protein V1792_12690 [Pseudomonadota bacterium]
MTDRQTWWNCSCGTRRLLTEERIKSGEENCPQCGAVVGEETDMGSSVADTQLINIGDMARMAQEGVDVGVSGEWDTTMAHNAKSSGDDDRDL